MNIEKDDFLPNLFAGESIGQPIWKWEHLRFDDSEGRQCFVGELTPKSADFVSYHCGQDYATKSYGIINSRYEIVLPFEYTYIEPMNPYFARDYIKKDTYYFRIRKGKNLGLVKVENNVLAELLPPVYIKIEQTAHIDYHECRIKNYSNLYSLPEEKFLFENGRYSSIEPTPFSATMFNLYTGSQCCVYDYRKGAIIVNDLQDIYFVNALGRSFQNKLYALNGTKLTQYNLDTLQQEALEIETKLMKTFRINGIKQTPMPGKYKKIIIEHYLK